MKLTKIVLSIVVFFITVQAAFASPKVGAEAPNFTATDSNGVSHSLSDFKDKIVVLEWVNYQCPFIKKHYKSQNMQNMQKQYTDKGVIWLSVLSSANGKQGYMTPAEANAAMKEKGAHPTAMLLDATGSVGKLYDAKTTPHMFVINKEGAIAYMGAIDSNDSVDPEDIPNATPYVANALDALLEGKAVAEPTATDPYGCSVKYDS